MINFKNINIIAVIPARGGSKRIPRKNIIEFKGKPLIAHTIEAALKSQVFDDVLISTDDETIETVAKQYGAKSPGLRTEAADDYTPVSEATIFTVKQYETQFDKKVDVVVQLFAVCPLRDDVDIRKALEYFRNHNCKFLLSCYKFTWMNPWWAFTMKADKPDQIFKDKLVRSQDLPKLYSPTGAIWIADRDALFEANTFYGPDHRMWEISWKHAIDIDSWEDLQMANVIYDIQF